MKAIIFEDNENTKIQIGDVVMDANYIKEYFIRRFNGKSGIELTITLTLSDIETQMDIESNNK